MRLAKICLILVGVFFMASCQNIPIETSEKDSDFRKITEADLVSLYGKRLTLDPFYLIVKSDGAFDAMWVIDDPVEGTWSFRNGLWCRVITRSETLATGIEECQIWKTNGNRIRGIRDRGRGDSFVYTIE